VKGAISEKMIKFLFVSSSDEAHLALLHYLRRSVSNVKENCKNPWMSEKSIVEVISQEGYDALKALHDGNRNILEMDLRSIQFTYQMNNLDPSAWKIEHFPATLVEIMSHASGHFLLKKLDVSL